MRARPPAGTRWYGKARAVWSRGQSRRPARFDTATMTLADLEKVLADYAALVEAYGELVQHRVVLGCDA
jgi:hypothetical protein